MMDTQAYKRQWQNSRLTDGIRQALLILLEGDAVWSKPKGWRGRLQQKIKLSTIRAMHDRYLVAIGIRDHGCYTLQYASLTEIGRHVAQDLQRAARPSETEAGLAPDDFEAATQAYGDRADVEMATP